MDPIWGLVLTGGDEEEKERRGVVADEAQGEEEEGGCLACDGHGAFGAGEGESLGVSETPHLESQGRTWGMRI